MDKNTPYTSVATIGIDLAKKVFQVHAVDSCGEVVRRRGRRLWGQSGLDLELR